ncbi:hypothetical protein, partial [Duganella lactea]|uniref:hypothetical protein n=1 Tax=Duganella lactea TaxID=2692173 RepID=UPI001E3DDE12
RAGSRARRIASGYALVGAGRPGASDRRAKRSRSTGSNGVHASRTTAGRRADCAQGRVHAA